MPGPFLPGVSANLLEDLAAHIRAGTLGWPVRAISLKAKGYSGIEGLPEGLRSLEAHFGNDAATVATVLSMLAAERAAAETEAKRRVSLVWSGPEGKSQSEDMALAIGRLFARAQRKVLISTYNVGWKRGLFGPLVDKMQRDPHFEVTIFVNINGELTREYRLAGEDPVAAFKRWFVATHWSAARLPAVYYDPRALTARYVDPLTQKEKHPPQLHAKCVIADDEAALVTSANFSDAAQNDNIEAGVLVEDARFVQALTQQFEGLVATKKLTRVI